jgi:hypothetical protein
MAVFLLSTVAEFTTTVERWAKKWELIELTSDTYPKYNETALRATLLLDGIACLIRPLLSHPVTTNLLPYSCQISILRVRWALSSSSSFIMQLSIRCSRQSTTPLDPPARFARKGT